MKKIGFSSVRITGGFWKTKQELIRKTTLYSVYHRFQDTHRFDALKCDWKEKGEYNGHIFWDSDVAKWLESAAYALEFERDAELEKIVDDTVALILKNRDENGYFNSYYLTVDQDQRFTIRDNHELYCAGHLMEAAVAYYHATGKDAFLKAMCRYADYIEKVFMIEKSAAFLTPVIRKLNWRWFACMRPPGKSDIWPFPNILSTPMEPRRKNYMRIPAAICITWMKCPSGSAVRQRAIPSGPCI